MPLEGECIKVVASRPYGKMTALSVGKMGFWEECLEAKWGRGAHGACGQYSDWFVWGYRGGVTGV